MAGFENMVPLILGSGDPVVQADPTNRRGNFNTPLQRRMVLAGKWEACLAHVSFNKPIPTPDPSSMVILLDILQPTTVGSSAFPVLFLTHPITAADTDPVVIDHNPMTQWKPIDVTVINSIRVQIQDISGNIIPDAGPQTTVEFFLRQVSDV